MFQGTGKSVIAIQLLSALIKDKGYNAFYVAKSAYVKENYLKKLTRDIPQYKFLRTLFMGSGNFMASLYNEFDVLLVDEAHRLTEKIKRGHLYLGENKIKEIINATKTSVFFIDETQNIDIKDFCTVQNIVKYTKEAGAIVHMDSKYELQSQFRCNGSDEYIAWLNAILYNKEYIPSDTDFDCDIQIFDDLYYENGQVKTNYRRHPEHAGEFRRPHQKRIFVEDLDHIDSIIRNTYKVLFTRGQKGTYLYVMDSRLKHYLQEKINELKKVC